MKETIFAFGSILVGPSRTAIVTLVNTPNHDNVMLIRNSARMLPKMAVKTTCKWMSHVIVIVNVKCQGLSDQAAYRIIATPRYGEPNVQLDDGLWHGLQDWFKSADIVLELLLLLLSFDQIVPHDPDHLDGSILGPQLERDQRPRVFLVLLNLSKSNTLKKTVDQDWYEHGKTKLDVTTVEGADGEGHVAICVKGWQDYVQGNQNCNRRDLGFQWCCNWFLIHDGQLFPTN